MAVKEVQYIEDTNPESKYKKNDTFVNDLSEEEHRIDGNNK